MKQEKLFMYDSGQVKIGIYYNIQPKNNFPINDSLPLEQKPPNSACVIHIMLTVFCPADDSKILFLKSYCLEFLF